MPVLGLQSDWRSFVPRNSRLEHKRLLNQSGFVVRPAFQRLYGRRPGMRSVLHPLQRTKVLSPIIETETPDCVFEVKPILSLK